MRRLNIAFSIFLLLSTSGTAFSYLESDLEKLKDTNACNGCDLSGANLSSRKLRGADLRKGSAAKKRMEWNTTSRAAGRTKYPAGRNRAGQTFKIPDVK